MNGRKYIHKYCSYGADNIERINRTLFQQKTNYLIFIAFISNEVEVHVSAKLTILTFSGVFGLVFLIQSYFYFCSV